MPANERKISYFEKLYALLEEYHKILVVDADNVGSHLLQKIRKSLRGDAIILMGKNTMVRKAIRDRLDTNPEYEPLLPMIKGNVGFVFTNGDLSDIKSKLLELRVGAAAKAGTIAPNDVTVPAGNTGLEPTMTSFLQSLNIPSKINRGAIEIIQDIELIKAGTKVGSSEASLLQKLNIKPFSYGLKVQSVYDEGSVYSADLLDVSEGDVLARFSGVIRNIAAISLKIGYPTIASVPHSLANGFKNLLAISLATEYEFEQAQKFKDAIANPGAAAAAAPAGGDAAPAEEEKAAVEEEEEESSEDLGGGGMFGDDDEW